MVRMRHRSSFTLEAALVLQKTDHTLTATPARSPTGTESQEANEEMDCVEEPAGKAADHGAVDTDVLEIVSGVLLDEPDRSLGPKGVHAPLDEPGDAIVVTLDGLHCA